jgi:hypothetical protein
VTGADQYDLQHDVASAIFSIRKIVKLFKYSPVRNSILQQEIIRNEKIELQVILHCKTLWNTLERMKERFLEILNPTKFF